MDEPRLNRDLKNIIDNTVPGNFVEPEKGNNTYVNAVIVGPDNTPCQGGLFHFVLKFPLDNPACPPQVRFMTTDGGWVRFNRKLYSSGLVSLSCPGTFDAPSWNPETSLKTLVVSIQSLLIDGTGDLPTAVIKHFVEHYDKYESVALSLLGEHSSVKESQQYAALLERQQKLHGHIVQNNPTMRKMLHCDYKGLMNC
ncbi:hypothetical protein MRX96_044965 [Rhipicephalus microplus]